jgi:molecular chaperone GrpE
VNSDQKDRDFFGGESADERESSSGAAEDSAGDGASILASLEERITKLEAEKEDLRSTLLRRQADFENFRKRVERERHEEGQRGVQRLVENELPVLDGFERALAAHKDPAYEEYRKGFELIYKQLWDVLSRHGVEPITAEGKQFDPHFHQAIERVETDDHADGAVIEVLQPGYLFHGRVLRPATVRVAAAPPEESKKRGH